MVRDADHVIVLAGGKIVAQGTPKQLIADGGWFASFSNSTGDENSELSIQEAGADEHEEDDNSNIGNSENSKK
jgi:ABC-type multidrug transport system ATPase subunit